MKPKYYIYLIFLFFAIFWTSVQSSAIPFSATWNTSAISTGSSNATTIKLPIYNGGTYNFNVSWGDGTTIQKVIAYNSVNATHTYNSSGVYTINITGTILGFRFANTGDRLKINNINQFGDLQLGNLNGYFYGCANLNISAVDNLNLTNATTNFVNMFNSATNFNGNINNWNVSNINDMSHMFELATNFNSNINSWDTRNVVNMTSMFDTATNFNQNIGNWNTGKVKLMDSMFSQATNFNQPIGNWNTSKVTTMSSMFYVATNFNQNLNGWNTSALKTIYIMFAFASNFNGNVTNWDTSNITDMGYAFDVASNFNQPIGNWNTSKVTSMSNMFALDTVFNQNISSWDTSKVNSMMYMFYNNTFFNQNISSWNTSKVTTMSFMFYNATNFNQNIGNWDIGNVNDLSSMFYFATSFNQNLGNWNVTKVTTMSSMFSGDTLSTQNYDSLLKGWSSQSPYLNYNVIFNAGNSKYSGCIGLQGKNILVNNFNWNIADGGLDLSYLCYPKINIIYPQNINYNVNISNLNYIINSSNPSICWYQTDLNPNSTTQNAGLNFTDVPSHEGNNVWIVYCNDTVTGFINYTSVAFFRDITSPTVTIITPLNDSSSYNLTQIFTFNATDNLNLTNVTLYLYNSTSDIINKTTINATGTNGIFDITYQFLTTGVYYWLLYVVDLANNIYMTSLRTFNIIPNVPLILISYPQNNFNYSSFVNHLDYSIQYADYCWYSLDNGLTNVSIPCISNSITNILSSNGINIWTVSGNNSVNNFTSAQVIFNSSCVNPNVQLIVQNYPYIDFNTTYTIKVSPFVYGNSNIKILLNGTVFNLVYDNISSYSISLFFGNLGDYPFVIYGDNICPTIVTNITGTLLVRNPYYLDISLMQDKNNDTYINNFAYITAEYSDTKVLSDQLEPFLPSNLNTPVFYAPYINGHAQLKLYEPERKYAFRLIDGRITFPSEYSVPNITKSYGVNMYLGQQILNGTSSNELIYVSPKDIHPYFWLFNVLLIIAIVFVILVSAVLFFLLPTHVSTSLTFGVGGVIVLIALRVIVFFWWGS